MCVRVRVRVRVRACLSIRIHKNLFVFEGLSYIIISFHFMNSNSFISIFSSLSVCLSFKLFSTYHKQSNKV